MPPRDETTTMDDDRPRASSARKPRPRSSKRRGEAATKDASGRQAGRKSRSQSAGKDRAQRGHRGEKAQRRKRPPPPRRSKNGSAQGKPSAAALRALGTKPSQGIDEGVPAGVTVSQFRARQQSMQDEAAGRRPTARQRLLAERHASNRPEGEPAHYFDDASDCENERAVVARDNRRPDDAPRRQPVVDAVPADHPASATIQTSRTCGLCHRTLPRAQFSERDRYTVHMSLAPGPTCRTCAMTVSAVKLKGLPDTEQLLLEYAQRGIQQGMLLMDGGQGRGGASGGGANVAGLLASGEDLTQNGNANALVVRQNAGAGGNELALCGGPAAEGLNNHGGIPNGAGANVNAAFAGRPYGHGDGDRPPNVADGKYLDLLLGMPCQLNLSALGIFKSSREASVSVAALEAVRVYGTLGEGYFVPHDCDGAPVPERKRGGQQEPEPMPGETTNAKAVVCLVLNEGTTPRTAVLASQHYGWTALAVDPRLGAEWDGTHDDVPNFTGYSGSIAEFCGDARRESTLVEFRRDHAQHLVIVGIQSERDSLRLKDQGNINALRARYDDVPTTLVSVSPVRKMTLAPNGDREGRCGSKLEKDVGYEPNCAYVDEGVFGECRYVEVWNFHNAEDDDDDEGEEGSEDSGSEEGDYSECSGEADDRTASDGWRDDRTVESERQTAESDGHSFGAQIKRAAKSKKKTKDAKRRNWLEDRVAAFQKEKEAHHDDARSMGTLSTKGTWDRLPSKEGVDMKLVTAVDRVREEYADGCPPVTEGSGHAAEARPWTPPDEDVWERAMAKHGEQETLVNQLEEYCIKGSQDEVEGDANEHGLPPGWEAILDPSSGDYYYNNWDSGEVTWDHPLGKDPMVQSHGGESASRGGESASTRGGTVDTSRGDTVDNSDYQTAMNVRGSAANITPVNPFDDDDAANDRQAETKPADNLKVYEQSARFDSDNEGSSRNLDDASSTSSAIGALSRWNESPGNASLPPSNVDNGQEEEEDMIQWSDEETDDLGPLVRTVSSGKKQPWHKRDAADDNASLASYELKADDWQPKKI
ncbi:hypothetical protein ACHAXT_006155 [Thalassiosira profunda]